MKRDMVYALAVLVFIEISIVQAFYGSVHQAKIGSSAAFKAFQQSPSSFSPSRGLKVESHLRRIRLFSTATEETKSVITVAAPILAKETCNWSEPVPYSQLVVGVPQASTKLFSAMSSSLESCRDNQRLVYSNYDVVESMLDTVS